MPHDIQNIQICNIDICDFVIKIIKMNSWYKGQQKVTCLLGYASYIWIRQ